MTRLVITKINKVYWDNFKAFSHETTGPGGTSGAHTTCCEERPVLLQVPSPAPGALLARLTVPA